MAQRKPIEKVTLEQVLKLVEQLTPIERAELCATMLEDQEDIRVAEERLKNPGKCWTQEELEQELDMAD